VQTVARRQSLWQTAALADGSSAKTVVVVRQRPYEQQTGALADVSSAEVSRTDSGFADNPLEAQVALLTLATLAGTWYCVASRQRHLARKLLHTSALQLVAP
jgi:hypothetical protein